MHDKKTDQRYRTQFLETIGGLSLYDEDKNKRYTIDQEDINLLNNHGFVLIGNIDKPDSYQLTMSILYIHNYLFDRILETNKNDNISLKNISKNVSSPIINGNINKPFNKTGNKCNIISPCHNFQRKRQTTVHYYSKKYMDDFKFIVVYPYPEFMDKEK